MWRLRTAITILGLDYDKPRYVELEYPNMVYAQVINFDQHGIRYKTITGYPAIRTVKKVFK